MRRGLPGLNRLGARSKSSSSVRGRREEQKECLEPCSELDFAGKALPCCQNTDARSSRRSRVSCLGKAALDRESSCKNRRPELEASRVDESWKVLPGRHREDRASLGRTLRVPKFLQPKPTLGERFVALREKCSLGLRESTCGDEYGRRKKLVHRQLEGFHRSKGRQPL